MLATQDAVMRCNPASSLCAAPAEGGPLEGEEVRHPGVKGVGSVEAKLFKVASPFPFNLLSPPPRSKRVSDRDNTTRKSKYVVL